ncbi:MAG: branched-chain amino acid ABC transporter permease [Candidatus Bathyarchaeota archaeon]|nr:MAG: branched-chain amino acid ABC transporter permease [Candidatus Bathyarchaeota archaeon]
MVNIADILIPISTFVTFFAVYLLVSLALNLQQGYTGIPNLGLFLSIIVGAVVTAVLPSRLAMVIYSVPPELNFIEDNAQVVALLNVHLASDPFTSIGLLLLTIVVAAGAGMVTGYLTSFFVRRLDETYLAVFLLALAEAARTIGTYYRPLAGGNFGISMPNFVGWFGADYYYLGLFILISSVSVLIFFLTERLCHSPFGRLLRSIREDELTAKTVGKDTNRVKMIVMALSSGILAVAGVLNTTRQAAAVIPTYDRIDFTFWPWLMVIVGGSGNNLGTLVGTISLISLRRVLIYMKPSLSFLPFSPIWFEHILLGIILLLVMFRRPEGLIPEKPRKLQGP